MKSTLRVLGVALVVSATVQSSLCAQTEAPPARPRPLTWMAFLYVANADIRRELRITETQAKQLDSLIADYDAARPRAPKRRSEMTPEEQEQWDRERREKNDSLTPSYQQKLDAILDDAQKTRLREIMVQAQVLIGGPTVAIYDEISKPLNASEDQIARLGKLNLEFYQSLSKVRSVPVEEQNAEYEKVVARRDEAANAVLTAEQRAKLVELQGRPFEFPARLKPVTKWR